MEELAITQVVTWQTQPFNDDPAVILKRHGYDLMAGQVAGVVKLTEKQRDGVYGGVDPKITCLTTRAAAPWFTATGPADARPQLDPTEFVRSTGTLYLVSREGEGTLGPLILALTVPLAEAAEQYAITQPGGRLAKPMLLALDEAANICRWPELPNLYSHYGSRGIIPMTILQSWSQGTEVWGENGMSKLWEAANVRVFGGGAAKVSFLEDLSRLIGHYDQEITSTSSSSGRGGGSRSRSTQTQRRRILDVEDLGALPRGRCVVFASGARPVLASTVPWFNGQFDLRRAARAHRHRRHLMTVGPLGESDFERDDDYVLVDQTTLELEPEADPEPQLAYPDAATWVREWLAHNFKRRISKGTGHVWAADWWRYPEAVFRIEAMWRAWEHLRLDPATGMSVWYRDHAEHHMRVLMDPDWGPFGKHGGETSDITEPLPVSRRV